MPTLSRPAPVLGHSEEAITETIFEHRCFKSDPNQQNMMRALSTPPTPVLGHSECGGAAQSRLAHDCRQHRGQQDHGDCEARGLQGADCGADLRVVEPEKQMQGRAG